MFFAVSRLGDGFGVFNFENKCGTKPEYLCMKLVQKNLIEGRIIFGYVCRKFAFFV